MNGEQEKSPLINKVLEKIKSGQVKMKPRLYFVLKAILIVAVISVVVISILFLISLISFNLKASGIGYLPRFGFPGFSIYLKLLPWALILICVVLIIALEVFTKRFSFVYRRPVVYSLIAIILLVFLGGFVIDKTPFHSRIFQQSQEGHLPLMGPFYGDIGRMAERDVYRGVVSELTDDGFILQTPREGTIQVITDQKTRFPEGEKIEKDEAVVVFGKKEDDKIYASGVLKVNDDLDMPSPFEAPIDGPMHQPPGM